jgi:pimeloyl-ACP methyl ester carboxylesterase
MSSRRVELSGGPTFRVQEWGRPDGAVVLLLHGLTSSSQSWRRYGPLLGEHFRVVAVDLPGHGESTWTGDYRFEMITGQLIRLLDGLGFYGVIPFGHSTGAELAYLLAADRPDMVRALVLVDPPTVSRTPALYIPVRARPDDRCDWRAVAQINRWHNAMPEDWWSLAAKISCPTLVVGAKDSHLPQDKLRQFAHRIPHSTYEIVDGGHNLHEARPGEFDTVIQPFLAPWAV